jgi:hypothetical protein
MVRLGGVFQGLPGILVPGHMITFAVLRCGNTVCVRGEIVKLCGSLVRVLRHMLASRMINFKLALRQRASAPVEA